MDTSANPTFKDTRGTLEDILDNDSYTNVDSPKNVDHPSFSKKPPKLDRKQSSRTDDLLKTTVSIAIGRPTVTKRSQFYSSNQGKAVTSYQTWRRRLRH